MGNVGLIDPQAMETAPVIDSWLFFYFNRQRMEIYFRLAAWCDNQLLHRRETSGSYCWMRGTVTELMLKPRIIVSTMINFHRNVRLEPS